MSDRRPEVAGALRGFETAYRKTHDLLPAQERVLRDLTRCRTAALGGHKAQCDRCGHLEIAYNSCRNRHCPKCLASAQAEWLAARAADVLEVPYFHVVFTLPEPVGRIALQNPRALYGMLFAAARKTLATLAADPKHLGAEIGFLALLHTWSQTLLHHPHIHCVVPGGGLSPDGQRWVPCRKDYFLPVAVLRSFFRGTFLRLLQQRWEKGKLALCGELEPLREPKAWSRLIRRLRKTKWVVYVKPPFGGPLQVLKYLARYTHRVAISNARILAVEHGSVVFRWKDRARGGRATTMRLEGVEFVRRFLLHALPSGFVRIRYFGLLANRARREKLEKIRALLAEAGPARAPGPPDHAETVVTPPEDPARCPNCAEGRLVVIERIPPSPDDGQCASSRGPP